MAPTILEMLAAGAVHFSLPAGDLLFASGSLPDEVYLVASGRLGVRTGSGERTVAEVERGEWVGESGWLLKEPRSATVIALRDTELLLLPDAVLDTAAAQSPQFSLAIAQLCARRLTRSNRAKTAAKRARVFALVPNSDEIDVAEFATQLTAELGRSGRAELMWDVRATTHTSAWFSRIEELNDYVLYVADPTESGWTRQCCRQADVVLCLAHARGRVRAWPSSIPAALTRGARIELALLHEKAFAAGAATEWLRHLPAAQHHHIVDSGDMGRVVRLLTGRGVGLVLSGGGARFAHLGVIRALREARIPLDFLGGADYSFSANAAAADGPPLWRFFARSRSGRQRINIIQVLMHAGMVNSVSSQAAQRALGHRKAQREFARGRTGKTPEGYGGPSSLASLSTHSSSSGQYSARLRRLMLTA